MSTGSQVIVAAPTTPTLVAKPWVQPLPAPTVETSQALANDPQPENATRLGHSLGAISVLPKRATGVVSRLTAFNSSNQGNATAIPKLPASWTVRPPIQAKLTVGQPNDQYEQEADRVADQVMRMAELRVQAKCACGGEAGPDGECAACKAKRLASETQVQTKPDEEAVIQTKADTEPTAAAPDLESRLNSSRGNGSTLPDETRSAMESAFGVDFGGVRVHTGGDAVQMNRELSAQAFTHGSDIYFNAGKYAPGSAAGKGLLAHELTHVVQQGAIQSKIIQRMAACPPHLNDNDPIPSGWRVYPGPTSVFHCGFRTILENRAPTPDDPMNECVYDHTGVLVDENHQFAGCRGTPDQYDSRTDPVRHATIDSGGIVAQGLPAFITSRVYEINTAIATAISTVTAIGNAVRNAIGSVLVQSILTGQAICSPSNWTYHATMPGRSRAHLNVIGSILSSISFSGNLNNLLTNLSKPLGDFPIAQLPTEIATDVNVVLRNLQSSETISADIVRRLSLLQLVDWLKEHGVISYNRPPDEIASEQMQQLSGEQHQ